MDNSAEISLGDDLEEVFLVQNLEDSLAEWFRRSPFSGWFRGGSFVDNFEEVASLLDDLEEVFFFE